MTCHQCCFWDQVGSSGDDLLEGWCRRYPPQITIERGTIDESFIQPITDWWCWCGEFQQRQDQLEGDFRSKMDRALDPLGGRPNDS